MLGLGVGAGFLGGAALGVAGTMASYSVYHKYQVREGSNNQNGNLRWYSP